MAPSVPVLFREILWERHQGGTMHSMIILLLCLTTVILADRRPTYSYGAPEESSSEESYESYESYESSEAKYQFGYVVEDESSENDFGHQESRDGDVTRGSYYVQLADGRLQKVTYYVDGDSGYVAEVSYEGEARYPESYESYESYESAESVEVPRYAPARPRYYYSPDSNESK